MKTDPDYFKKGETIKASHLNSLVDLARQGRTPNPVDSYGESRNFRPFDPISLFYDDDAEDVEGVWKMILKPSWIITGSIPDEISYEDDTLSEYPEITIPDDGKWLFLNTQTATLSWEDPDSSLLLILKVTFEEEEVEEGEAAVTDLQVLNMHPSLVQNILPSFWGSITTVPDTDPVEYKVKIAPGYLTFQNIGAESAPVQVVVPKMNGVPINENPEPFEVTEHTYVYLKVMTDKKGLPNPEEVTVEAFPSEQTSTHHNPDSEEEVEGEYYFLLLETEGGQAIKRLTGDKYLPNQLVEFENVGGGRKVYKRYTGEEGDKHEIRTLEQLEDEGRPIIKPLGVGAEEGDTIQFRQLKNQDGEEGATIMNDGLSTDDSIVFARIRGKDSPRQINVTKEGTGADAYVKIAGNSTDRSESNVRNFSIDVIDGLVSSFNKVTSGWHGNVVFSFQPVGESTISVTLSFVDGALQGVSGGTSNTGDGDADVPGHVEFFMDANDP